jgi:hypothetical protein
MGVNNFALFSLSFMKLLFTPTLALPLLGEGIEGIVLSKYLILLLSKLHSGVSKPVQNIRRQIHQHIA